MYALHATSMRWDIAVLNAPCHTSMIVLELDMLPMGNRLGRAVHKGMMALSVTSLGFASTKSKHAQVYGLDFQIC